METQAAPILGTLKRTSLDPKGLCPKVDLELEIHLELQKYLEHYEQGNISPFCRLGS